jgi:predicted transcriptional regulator
MAKPDKDRYLSKREQQIMDLLLAHGDLSATEIEELLPDAPTNSTVRSLLTIMGEKGVTTRVKSCRSYVYRLSKPRANAARDALTGVVQRFFNGSVGNAVTALLETRKQLSEEENEAIQSLIDSSKERKQ